MKQQQKRTHTADEMVENKSTIKSEQVKKHKLESRRRNKLSEIEHCKL